MLNVNNIIKSVKKFWNTKVNKNVFLFCIFLIFYLVLGIQLSYNYDFNGIYDLLFDADTSRVIGDMTDIFANHYRLLVHPLVVIIMEPIYFIISGITQNKMLALIIISSVISAITVVMVHKIISLFCNNKKINMLIALCYGFAFSNFIFTAGIELYNISAFGLLIMWYFIAKKLNEEWKKGDLFILIILGLLSLSIIITNYVVFLIGCLVLLISKKVKFKDLILVNITVIILFIIASYFQGVIWQNTPVVENMLTTDSEEKNNIDFSIDFAKLKNVIKNDCCNSIISSNLEVNKNVNFIIEFSKTSMWNFIIISAFLVATAIITLKNFKKNLYLNIGLILTFIFNFVFHSVYGNSSCFLYSLHFLYLFFLLLGINYTSENKTGTRLMMVLLITLGVSEIIINCKEFLNVLAIVSKFCNKNYYVSTFSFHTLVIISILVILFVITLLSLLIYYIKEAKKAKDNTNKCIYSIMAVICVILIESVFVVLQTVPHYKKILGRNLEPNSNVDISVNEEISKENIEVSDISVSESYVEFTNEYESEVNAYSEYVQEYRNFINEYNCTIYKGLPDVDFYLFGMGNRRKILFKDDKLIDIDDGTTIRQFKVKKYLIIPNEYTVLIKEEDGKFIKIYENNQGVYIESTDEKEIIDGTKIDINLYTFDKQKYKNFKKVLYSEILFNIKDSKLYPNIIVYDEPFYRDAAMACMVLKQTNNADLVSEWISSIDKIYDEQNAGEKEPDNLGELLYMISTQENKNTDLITKIEQEAERIASSNPDGYYLYGKTDFSNEYKYQNMWYDFGMKALGKKSKFNYKDLNDGYQNLAWWMSRSSQKEAITDEYFPYIGWANYHASNKKGKLMVNNKLYPLSWEKCASQADYSKMQIIDEQFVTDKVSPVHLWSASEMILFILDETGNLVL